MFAGTFCHKDPEDMDRTGDDDKQNATMGEPDEQEDNKEDKETPAVIFVEIEGLGNMSMKALQFANTMAIVNMINKQERDILTSQGEGEAHNEAEPEKPIPEAWGMLMAGNRMIPASMEQFTSSIGLWFALQNAHLQGGPFPGTNYPNQDPERNNVEPDNHKSEEDKSKDDKAQGGNFVGKNTTKEDTDE